jgi:hypothetical protein
MLVYDLTGAIKTMNRRYVGFRNTPRPTSASQVIAHLGSPLNLRSNEGALQYDLKSSRSASLTALHFETASHSERIDG